MVSLITNRSNFNISQNFEIIPDGPCKSKRILASPNNKKIITKPQMKKRKKSADDKTLIICNK